MSSGLTTASANSARSVSAADRKARRLGGCSAAYCRRIANRSGRTARRTRAWSGTVAAARAFNVKSLGIQASSHASLSRVNRRPPGESDSDRSRNSGPTAAMKSVRPKWRGCAMATGTAARHIRIIAAKYANSRDTSPASVAATMPTRGETIISPRPIRTSNAYT